MVIIKSYHSGISLHLGETDDFEQILSQVAEKFEESRKFFKNASVAISIEDRLLSTDEERQIIQTIEEHSDIQIMCIIGKDEETNRKFIKALKRIEDQKEEYNCRYVMGNVLGGQVIESEGNLVIVGNVMKGSTLAASKNIIVMGELLGEAYAGMDKERGHFITALRLSPEKCKIGELSFKISKNGIFAKKKNESSIIYEKDGQLISEVISPEAIANAASI